MSKDNEYNRIRTEIEEVIGLSEALEIFLEEYEEYSKIPDIHDVVRKYIDGLNRNIKWWRKLENEFKKRGLEKAGDYSARALEVKLMLGRDRVSNTYDEFESELRHLGLIYDFQEFTVMNMVSDEDLLLDDMSEYEDLDIPDCSYILPFAEMAENNEPYTLSDMTNMQIRREIKDLEEKLQAAVKEQYKVQQKIHFGREGEQDDEDAISNKCFLYQSAINIRKTVLKYNRK